MREYATRPTKYISKTICDWCGCEVKELQDSSQIVYYSDDEYSASDMYMHFNFGSYFYGEGLDWEKQITIDLCPLCRIKLLNEMEKLGIKINENMEE